MNKASVSLPVAVLIIALALALVFVPGCSKNNEEHRTASPAANSPNVTEVISVEQRADKAPNFTWKDSTGKTVSLESLKGQVVFVNFYATWCGPCRKELPDLADLSRSLGNRNVRFIGASMDRGPNIIEDVRSFVKQQGLPYQNVLATDDLAEAFGNVRLLPTSFLIDREGKIVQTFVGIRSKETYANNIAQYLQ